MPTGFLPNLTDLDPVLILQGAVLACAFLLLFLLLYTLRDILLRTHSFWLQAFCVLLTGALPIAGFLVYLLIRPARTLREREMEEMLRDVAGRMMKEDDDEDEDEDEDEEESKETEETEVTREKTEPATANE